MQSAKYSDTLAKRCYNRNGYSHGVLSPNSYLNSSPFFVVYRSYHNEGNGLSMTVYNQHSYDTRDEANVKANAMNRL